jgi:hypothetical protein
MAGFKSAAKRKRELAKLDKRNAKDQKRAVRKAERARAEITAPALPTLATTQHRPAAQGVAAAAAARKPLTLAEAVERWKTTKVGTHNASARTFG